MPKLSHSDSDNGDTEDFSVLPTTTQNAASIFEFFEQLSRQSNRTKSQLLFRRTGNQSDADFFLTTAINAVEMTSTLFRKGTTADPTLTAVWLSLTKIHATRIVLNEKLQPFTELTLDNLRTIAVLSLQVEALGELQRILASNFGIVLIFELAFPGMKTDGCVYKLTNGTPVVGLSLRYNRYDYFWFTLMHELSHIALHYQHLDTPIIDDLEEQSEEDLEVEANRTASNALVPRSVWRKMWTHRDSLQHLESFSREAEIHPAISAGLLRNKMNNFAVYSDLVHSIDVKARLGISNA
jgi:HTH-type transcriptional regulator/antitoxin HigA